MYIKLFKSDNALKGKGITKFSLKCEEDKDKWFNLLNILYKNDNYSAIILHLWKFKMPINFYNF